MGLYVLGNQVTVFYTFTVGGAPTDPTTVVFTVEQPDGTVDTFTNGDPEVTNPSVGYYELAYMPASQGTYEYNVEGTGAVVAKAPTGSFTVLADAITEDVAPGPCDPWITGDDVAQCCGDIESSAGLEFETAAYQASLLLFDLSGRRFAGMCGPKTVRPLCRPNCPCGQVLSRGHIVPSPRWDWWGLCEGPCDPSRVLLSGYPVRAITEVKIDGAVINQDGYRLERKRWLVRKGGDRWPACQNMGLDDDEEGTWSVSYTFGQDPPITGIAAASELACEIYKSCNSADDCAIPQGAVRVTRAGITIERGVLRHDPLTKAWKTGMFNVDLFLNTVNPTGMLRRPMVQSPASQMRMARRVA